MLQCCICVLCVCVCVCESSSAEKIRILCLWGDTNWSIICNISSLSLSIMFFFSVCVVFLSLGLCRGFWER